jgi:hypothetical protein
LLANVALHVLDEAWTADEAGLGVLVRYCDDFVILCTTKARAEQARIRVAAILAGLGLRLHPDKTRVVHVAHGSGGFDFLGFHHRKMPSWKHQDRWYLQKWPSQRAMATIRAKIKAATDRRSVGRALSVVVEDLNPVLRGWGQYFRWGNSTRKFYAIDRYVNERLAILASRKQGRRGRNWARFSYAWTQSLGVYQLTGRVRYYRAVHASR